MRQRVQVHLREHPEARVHLRLERQREVHVEQVVPRAPRVVPEEHVERGHFEQRPEGTRERAHEGVEHEQLAGERRGPGLRLEQGGGSGSDRLRVRVRVINGQRPTTARETNTRWMGGPWVRVPVRVGRTQQKINANAAQVVQR